MSTAQTPPGQVGAQTPTLGRIHELLAAADRTTLKPLKIVILRNVVVETIAPYLQFEGLKAGFDIEVVFGGFDTIGQDVMAGREGPLGVDPDVIVVWTFLEQLSRKLSREFPTLSTTEINAEVARVESFIAMTVTAIRRTSSAPILWTGFEGPVRPAFGAADLQSTFGQSAVIARLNQALREQLNGAKSGSMLDTGVSLVRLGMHNFYDWRYWHLSRAPYAREALRDLSAELMKLVRAAKGGARKCLVVDCDNTLWGGIVGEEGPSRVHVGHEYPGSSYRDFQQEIVNLHHRGVLIALASRNNADDVWEVFASRSEMVLKREHIAAARIDWNDKASSLRSIAEELNIGLDSLVFVDDSEFECGSVEKVLPQVAVIRLPADRPYEFSGLLACSGLFDTFTVTEEDKTRHASYQAEAKRAELYRAATDLGEYLASLEMTLEISHVSSAMMPRVAQLTQRTNQFNLTTRRYSETDIHAFCSSDTAEVFAARLSDRFSDYGIIGACILCYRGAQAAIDSFMVSCRALGRGVEHVLLDHVLAAAKQRGCRVVEGRYIATPKNGQVSDFFDREGFRLVGESDGVRTYKRDLGTFVTPRTGSFRVIRGDAVAAND